MDEYLTAAVDLEGDPKTHALRLAAAILRERGLDPELLAGPDGQAIADTIVSFVAGVLDDVLDDVLHPPGSPTH